MEKMSETDSERLALVVNKNLSRTNQVVNVELSLEASDKCRMIDSVERIATRSSAVRAEKKR